MISGVLPTLAKTDQNHRLTQISATLYKLIDLHLRTLAVNLALNCS